MLYFVFIYLGFLCFAWCIWFFFFWVTIIEAKGSQGGASRVVERWGELDSSKCVLAASINDRKDDPVCVGVLQIV